MKKIGIVTLNGNYNFGNKLQNYALLNYTKNNFDSEVFTVWTDDIKEKKNIKYILRHLFRSKGLLREKKFAQFNNYLNIKKYNKENIKDEYNYYIIGSDQVWNYKDPIFYPQKYFALFSEKSKNISYAASFGLSNIETEIKATFENGLENFNYISVREYEGKKIVEDITKRRDIEVLIDPTMLLSENEWTAIAVKPPKIGNSKFILKYFLGNVSSEKNEQIEKVAQEHGWKVIDILDKNDPFYISGPREFLWLEKNANLICTDSFHSSVFAIVFNRPFVVFERDDKLEKMSSRIDTLLTKFKLENRKYNGVKITQENLENDYSKAYEILKEEQKKSYDYLKKALNEKND